MFKVSWILNAIQSKGRACSLLPERRGEETAVRIVGVIGGNDDDENKGDDYGSGKG
jgi:hypothetical protein